MNLAKSSKKIREDHILQKKKTHRVIWWGKNQYSFIGRNRCLLELPQAEMEGLNALVSLLKMQIELTFVDICHVEHLLLSNLNLQHFPLFLTKFSFLKNLILSGNSITIFPDSIEKLIHLEHLSLSNNQIINIPQSLGKHTCLKSINLTRNRISLVPFDCFRPLSRIILDISHNPLRSLSGLPQSTIYAIARSKCSSAFRIANPIRYSEGQVPFPTSSDSYSTLDLSPKAHQLIEETFFFSQDDTQRSSAEENPKALQSLFTFYAKHPAEICQQYISGAQLSREEIDRLIHEASAQEYSILGSNLDEKDPVLQKLQNRFQSITTVSTHPILL